MYELPSPYKELPDLGREIRSCLDSVGLWPMAIGAVDIETGRSHDWEEYYRPSRVKLTEEDAIAHKNEFRDAAALHPFAMRIRLVTITDSLGNHAQIWSDLPDPVANEKEVILRTFLAMGSAPSHVMWLGVNLLKFDIPRMVQRALVHRLNIPEECRGYRTRWADRRLLHINDLMEYMAQGGDTKGLTLHNMARAFGLPGKTGDFGHDFGEEWDTATPEARKTLCLYNLIDNDQCLRVALYSNAILDYARKYQSDFKMKEYPKISKTPFILPYEMITHTSLEGDDHFKRERKTDSRRIPMVTPADRVVKLDDIPVI